MMNKESGINFPGIFSVLLFSIFFILLSAPAAHALTLTQNLSLGSSGPQVSSLQEFLRDTKDFTHPRITGFYGTVTQVAVQKYQCRVLKLCSGTPSTNGYGNVGPKTRASMNTGESGGTTTPPPQTTTTTPVSPPVITQTLSFGMTNNEVRLLQEYLKSTGDYTYPTITGFYGTATEDAVKRYQARKGIVSSGTPSTTGYGVVGSATRASFASNASPSNTSANTPGIYSQGAYTPASAAVALFASPPSVVPGQSATLSWYSMNVSTCTASGGWSGGKKTEGTELITNITNAMNFVLSCTGLGGSVEASTNIYLTNATSGTYVPPTPTYTQGSYTTNSYAQGSYAPAYTQGSYTPTSSGTPQCADGIDNDNDGKIDWNGVAGTGGTTPTGPTSGLVAHWKFDETTGTTAQDSAGNNTGTLINGPAWTQGKMEGALQFNGTNTYVNMGNSSAVNNLSTVSVAGWIWADTVDSYNYIFSNDRDCCTTGIKGFSLFLYSANQGYFQIWDANGVKHTTEGSELSANQWHHIVGTYDGAVQRLYVDGIQVASAPWTGTIGTPASFQAAIGGMGYSPASFNVNGKLDDVRIYNRALTASEVTELYNATETGGTPGIPADPDCIDASDTTEAGSTPAYTQGSYTPAYTQGSYYYQGTYYTQASYQPASSAPVITFTATPTSVTSGGSTTLTWSSTNATSCTASGTSNWNGTRAQTGQSTQGNLTANTTFNLSCTGPGGTTPKSVTVSVSAPVYTQGTYYTQGSYAPAYTQGSYSGAGGVGAGPVSSPGVAMWPEYAGSGATPNGTTINVSCNGSTGDTGTVQNAFNQVGNGGTVKITGMCGVGSAGLILENKSNVTVRGSGRGTGFRALAKPATNADEGGDYWGPVMVEVKNSNHITIRDLEFDMNRMETGAATLRRVDYSLFENNYIHWGIANNFTGQDSRAGVAGRGGNGGNRNNVYRNNEFNGGCCSVGEHHQRAIFLNGDVGALIELNIFRNQTHTTIGTTDPVGIKIVNNGFFDNTYAGTKLDLTQYHITSDLASRSYIIGNVMSRVGNGMEVNYYSNLEVRNNRSVNNHSGIALTGAEKMANILIENNVLCGNAEGAVWNLWGSLEKAQNLVMRNNEMAANGDCGKYGNPAAPNGAGNYAVPQ